MNDSQRALVEVLALAEKATPGEFTVVGDWNVFAGDGSSATGLQTNYSDSYGRNVANAAYIAAACNYVRTHGPQLFARLAAAELDGARLDWLARRNIEVRDHYGLLFSTESSREYGSELRLKIDAALADEQGIRESGE